MTAKTALAQYSRFKIGWIILLICTALMTLNHLSLIFIMKDESDLFAGYAAFNLYALIVILLPFRRYEKWAWLTSWILPVGLALPALMSSNSTLLVFYLAVSAFIVLGLLLSMREFFTRQ